MNIAEHKKQNNIVEYIIHMYQTEDLIRVFDMDIENISQYVIKHIPEGDASKEELIGWYQAILDQMNKEGIEKSGHLSETQKIVEDLNTLKQQLLSSDEEFEKIYSKASPFIREFISMSEGKINDEIQICINGVYGILLARINGKKVPDEVQPALDQFGNVLSYLSYKYKQQNFLNDN
ncbi:DUF4924 family protein [Fulvivirga sp.]|uniref:DUF4924 family protein n=1 Tax=Fulvivirga sp. TaxID=1931237 RepID=UPI0032EBB4C3